ncbi:uncharacterized protein G2W53_032260 [Senna tora]|uniref:Uncharacterized protein n=1 Tax=Senna tora TaxID=362788 RepID=A0A834SWE8_9FABA|nr:uncharacterized protein G2W53_032260 [Senna tora]
MSDNATLSPEEEEETETETKTMVTTTWLLSRTQ